MSNIKQAVPHRMQGVQSNTTESSGAPKSVVSIEPMEQMVIHYYDETGRPVTNILIRVGGKCYFPPNGVEWAKSLKPAAEWVQNAAKRIIGNPPKNNHLPAEDEVDVMGGASGEAPPAK